jgi:hypothetical protein
VLQLHIVDHLRSGGKKGTGGHIAVLNVLRSMSRLRAQSSIPALQPFETSEEHTTVGQ